MGQDSKIEWTNATWELVAAGAYRDPFMWPSPLLVFVNPLDDFFGEFVSERFLDHVFAVMAINSQHTFIILTERPEAAEGYFLGSDSLEDLFIRWGVAAGRLLDGGWIHGEGKRFRIRIERFISVSHGEVCDDEEPLTPEELEVRRKPLGNVWIGAVNDASPLDGCKWMQFPETK